MSREGCCVPALSPHWKLIHGGDVPAYGCIASTGCHEMCKSPRGLGKVLQKGLGTDRSGAVDPEQHKPSSASLLPAVLSWM